MPHAVCLREAPHGVGGRRDVASHHRVRRMRTLLRFATASPVEAGLRELIAEAEQRLAALQERRQAGQPVQPGKK